MASNLTVKVHPSVYMQMVDAYERKSSSNIGRSVTTTVLSAQRQERMESRALGTLLGFYEKNVVQVLPIKIAFNQNWLKVTNCYAIPFRESGNDTPEINDSINRSMLMISKKSSPTEQIVGWCVPILYHSHMNFRFFTVPDLPDTCSHYHTYYTNLMAQEATKKEQPPVILLTMDVTFGENPNRLPVKAFTAYIILFFICKLFILMISEGMQEFRGKTKSKHTFSIHWLSKWTHSQVKQLLWSS